MIRGSACINQVGSSVGRRLARSSSKTHSICDNSRLRCSRLIQQHPIAPGETATSFFSTKANSNQIENSNSAKCPFTGTTSRDLSTGALDVGALEHKSPTLQHVPAVPIMGSFIEAVPLVGKFLNENFYKLPNFGKDNAYDYYTEMYKRFGSFYCVGMPGVGKGIYASAYVIGEPEEMKKVIRQEGAFPRGGVEGLTGMIRWGKEKGMSMMGGSNKEDNGFFGRGEVWRNQRTFLQTDLLAPKSAAGYVPGVIEAAKIASQGVPDFAHDMNTFFNYAAFDMFQSIFFGELTKVSNPNVPSDPLDMEFIHNAVTSLTLLIQMQFDKQEAIKSKMGIKTPLYEEFAATMDVLQSLSQTKLKSFIQKWENNELDEHQQNSYFARALERATQDSGEGTKTAVTVDTLTEIALLMLNASVDTTATFISWATVHLSTNLEVQEKLYEELKKNLDENNGELNASMLTKAKSPYLHAVLRESHRITPVMPMVMLKSNSVDEIKIHGVTIPKDSIVGFDSYSRGMDPNVIDDPETFRPERWEDKEIEARKGTPAEALDHVFYRDPFSQGARRCPGSRIAVNETNVILAQMVLDWKFTAPGVQSYKDVPYEIKTLLVPKIPKLEVEARN